MTLLLVLNIAITVVIIIATITYFKNREIPCKWAVHGCKQRHRRSVLAIHEDKCAYREIHCPALHRGSCVCIGSGSVAQMLTHVREKPCIQVLRVENVNQPFKSFIGDYTQPELTVFNQGGYVYWRPILLVGPGVSGYLVYITVHRTPAGMWFITPRSYSPERILQRMEIKIEVFKSQNQALTWNPTMCIYKGGIASNQLSNQEAQEAGKVMIFGDGLVKSLKTENSIFDYKIDVTPVVPLREN